MRVGFVLLAAMSLIVVSASKSTIAQDAAAKSDEVKTDSDKLPPGYEAPPDRLAIMDLDAPLADKDELARYKRDSANFTKVRQACDTSPAARKAVEAYVRYRFAESSSELQ